MSAVSNVAMVCFVFLIPIHGLFAQQKPTTGDTTLRYENVEGYNNQKGFTRFLYRLFYRPVAAEAKLRTAKQLRAKDPDTLFQGKVIRNISVQTLDPFGNTVNDSTTSPVSLLSGMGNHLHIKTHTFTITNLLLFRSGQTYDSLLVIESERLIRSMQFVADVSFFTQSVSPNVDSVDIVIRVLDVWSIVPVVSFTSGRLALELGDDNFLGTGHALHNRFLLDRKTGHCVNQGTYLIPNIGSTFIHSILQYGTDELGIFRKGVAVERSFFSPYSQWAAGIGMLQQSQGKPMGYDNGLRYLRNAQDLWAGSALQLFKGDSEYCRTTRFVVAARFLRIRYPELPLQTLDSASYFTKENLYLTTFALSSRQFIQDQYVFKFGLTEDIPVGKIISLTSGYQQKSDLRRMYFAVSLAYGHYPSWGYLRPSIVLGTFRGTSGAEEGVFGAEVYCFSGLIEVGRWRFRQFVKTQIMLGLNRATPDYLTLNNDVGITGFNSLELAGTGRMLFSLQTQSYPPWSFIGFDFGPYFTFSLGILKDHLLGFRGQKVYSHLGLGVLIKNQRLLMNNFQISISYYPVIPGQGTNLFRFNSFQTNDFGLTGFEIEKPAILNFR